MRLTMWLIIRKSDDIVVGTSYHPVPVNAWDAQLFTIKEWVGPEPFLDSADPSLENKQFLVGARFSTEDFEILDAVSEGTTEQAALKVKHGGKIGWIHIHAAK